jgi:hypothetical protein
MKLHADSGLVKFAYWYRYYVLDAPHRVPNQTTLCRFFWRVVLAPFLLAFYLATVGVLVVSVFTVVSLMLLPFGRRMGLGQGDPKGELTARIKRWPRIFGLRITLWTLVSFPFALLVGYRPTMFEGDEEKAFVEVQRWPTIHGFRILPLVVLLIGAAAGYGYQWTMAMNRVLSTTIRFHPWVYNGLTGLVMIGLVIWLVWFLKRTAFGQLAGQFLKAKKGRICPIIPIEGVPEPPKKPAQATQ